jgi:hypothetical protein
VKTCEDLSLLELMQAVACEPTLGEQQDMARKPRFISHWYKAYDDLQISPKDSYDAVEKAVRRREIPDLRVGRVTSKEGGEFSDFREYLRITHRRYQLRPLLATVEKRLAAEDVSRGLFMIPEELLAFLEGPAGGGPGGDGGSVQGKGELPGGPARGAAEDGGGSDGEGLRNLKVY